MELKTKSKRPSMDCSIDVFYEQTEGFSKHLNDKENYKMVLVSSGSFVVEEDGEYKMISAPAGIVLNEKADFRLVSESNVKCDTICFKPTFIREEFTFEAIDSGKYEKFFSAVKDDKNMSWDEKFGAAVNGGNRFDDSFYGSLCQDYLLLAQFISHERNIRYWTLLTMEYQVFNRFFKSVKYDLEHQPDNFWILRTRYFINSILFTATADFYRPFRQYELFKDRFVAKVAMYLSENLADDITIAGLTRRFSVNKNQLNDAFYKETSMSCLAYLEDMRMTLARRYLQTSDLTVSEISNLCGYRDQNYFSKVFKKHTGMSATEYQKQMKGMC
ncbi:MAG: helix-turn-helix transcriptional regulator [Ruminococcaceae bacterium]|nr:helix-turn-helix transcriptional regulator [Oscillospiraceae bacterium]